MSEAELARQDAEWVRAADGILERQAARVIVFDPAGRVLLVRGHDIDDREHYWWFTIGGGLKSDDARRAAVRELGEETGVRIDVDRLVGPVLKRDASFHFVRQTRRQHEQFFLAHLSHADLAGLDPGRDLTPLEREVLDEFRWFTPEQIRRAQAAGQTFYPRGLADMAESWWRGWDGLVRHVVEE